MPLAELLLLDINAMSDDALDAHNWALRDANDYYTDEEEAAREAAQFDTWALQRKRKEAAETLRMAKYNAILEAVRRPNSRMPIADGKLVLEVQVLYCTPPSDTEESSYVSTPQGDPTGRMLFYVVSGTGKRIDSFYGEEGSVHVRPCHDYPCEPDEDDRYIHCRDLSMEE